LWSLPEIAADADIPQLCAQRYGAKAGAQQALPRIAHGFTHFKLDIDPCRVEVRKIVPRAAAPGVMWLPVEEALGAAIPAPVRRILAAL